MALALGTGLSPAQMAAQAKAKAAADAAAAKAKAPATGGGIGGANTAGTAQATQAKVIPPATAPATQTPATPAVPTPPAVPPIPGAAANSAPPTVVPTSPVLPTATTTSLGVNKGAGAAIGTGSGFAPLDALAKAGPTGSSDPGAMTEAAWKAGPTAPAAASPAADPMKDTNKLYQDLLGSQDTQWQNQQHALQGDMANFNRQADSLNARMGGSIAGGYAGLQGAALGQGMNAYNNAANTYQTNRQATMAKWMDAQLQQGSAQQQHDWSTEAQDKQSAQDMAMFIADHPGLSTEALNKLQAGTGTPTPAGATPASGANTTSQDNAKAHDLDQQPPEEQARAKATLDNLNFFKSKVSNIQNKIQALKSGALGNSPAIQKQMADLTEELSQANHSVELARVPYQQYYDQYDNTGYN